MDCVGSNDTPYYHSSEIELPKGTIKALTGKELTWNDEPIEICKYETDSRRGR